MAEDFQPDYQNIVDAARNRKPRRIPLYEHLVSVEIMERMSGEEIVRHERDDLDLYFKRYNGFFRRMGYDTVSYEGWLTSVLPGGGALGGHKDGCIKTMADFQAYPWESLPGLFFERYDRYFAAMGRQLPDGMKAIGGVGNGVFECVQDLTGYTGLCYIAADDPELYGALFERVGGVMAEIWKRLLDQYGDSICVCRMGDDLGFHTATLLSAADIRQHIIPQYGRIVALAHQAGKPFLLHSCGCIFSVMDDLIETAGIDAKHSNEDSIAPFSRWIDDYGARIGNFGGIDTGVLCDISGEDLDQYVTAVYRQAEAKPGGVALGSGNSIPDYVSTERYGRAVGVIRRLRGEDIG